MLITIILFKQFAHTMATANTKYAVDLDNCYIKGVIKDLSKTM